MTAAGKGHSEMWYTIIHPSRLYTCFCLIQVELRDNSSQRAINFPVLQSQGITASLDIQEPQGPLKSPTAVSSPAVPNYLIFIVNDIWGGSSSEDFEGEFLMAGLCFLHS